MFEWFLYVSKFSKKVRQQKVVRFGAFFFTLDVFACRLPCFFAWVGCLIFHVRVKASNIHEIVCQIICKAGLFSQDAHIYMYLQRIHAQQTLYTCQHHTNSIADTKIQSISIFCFVQPLSVICSINWTNTHTRMHTQHIWLLPLSKTESAERTRTRA